MHTIAPDTIVDHRYRVLRRLGTGGMSEVWCAEDEVLGRQVALKLLGGRFAEDPEFRERFRREAQAAASLTHPNIVAIFDRSEWEGVPYIAMELVDGRTLKELVRDRGPLPPEIAIGLIEQVLRALAYAHRRGIVHRDVKSQNVLLDAEGVAKVADFGIARAGDSDMTQTGTIVGTVQYVSPEQAEGRPVDRRSDLYSAGVVLYELLTGRVPFDGEAPIAIAIKHINERPVPPSQLRPGIPPALESVVLRAMEKDPARRYQSAEEFIAALEQVRRRPVVMQPPEPDPAPRTRWWLWAIAGVAVAAIAVGVFLTVRGNRVDVPNLVGRTSSDAADVAHRRGLEIVFEGRESEDVPRDQVISQDPAAGDEAREGSTITAVVSSGRGQSPVPSVEGASRDDAEKAITDAGFKADVKQAYSDSVPEDEVISQSPAAGTSRTRGSTVRITVSRGVEGVSVPSVVGLQRDAADTALGQVGLKSDVTEQETTKPAGTVLKQDPAAGASVEKGTTVKLIVAKGRPQVPDVTTDNPTADEATQTLEDAGYKVQTRDRPGDPTLVGRVVGQSPDPGTSRSTGATITIFVGTEAVPTPTPTPTP
ncbi:MAG TPA: PASTA domain-containing protein [Solirubrobacter sp.]|nr:PASTA domain-containing protein [Solirubrobacter sp.]